MVTMATIEIDQKMYILKLQKMQNVHFEGIFCGCNGYQGNQCHGNHDQFIHLIAWDHGGLVIYVQYF